MTGWHKWVLLAALLVGVILGLALAMAKGRDE